ncbi:MAG TPA: DUF1629 domain-containing protein [Blastocatellia bacterium]|nr:DUF1629 domain-containing protein [Blastocatellia bacterium]
MSGEKTTLIRQTRKRKRKLFVMSFDYTRGGRPGLRLQNGEVLAPGDGVLHAPSGRCGFPNYPEPPLFLFDRKLGRIPRDLELFNAYSLVSDRMKVVFQAIDPDAFAFVRCEVIVPQGKYDGPDYWLCDVVRVLDALDEAGSRLKIERRGEPDYPYAGEKHYSIAGATKLAFRRDAIGDAHVFRMAHGESIVICDDVLKDACKAAGLKGIKFRDASKL